MLGLHSRCLFGSRILSSNVLLLSCQRRHVIDNQHVLPTTRPAARKINSQFTFRDIWNKNGVNAFNSAYWFWQWLHLSVNIWPSERTDKQKVLSICIARRRLQSGARRWWWVESIRGGVLYRRFMRSKTTVDNSARWTDTQQRVSSRDPLLNGCRKMARVDI